MGDELVLNAEMRWQDGGGAGSDTGYGNESGAGEIAGNGGGAGYEADADGGCALNGA